MTPEIYGSWLLQVAMSFCVVAGAATIIVSVRTGWILKAIAWSTVGFCSLGALMLLAPKWTSVAFEYGQLKTTITRLQEVNSQLVAEKATYQRQIQAVAQLKTGGFKTAQDAVASYTDIRNKVEWADFLPSDTTDYRLEVAPNNEKFANDLAEKLNTSPANVSRAFEDSGYTVLKQPTPADLESNPASYLWVTPR
ncbi:MAG: hypothetical protein KK478_00115 [Ensifer alkalisoli]|nr:hypothetical protein [Sinorhizobium alkalisoli]